MRKDHIRSRVSFLAVVGLAWHRLFHSYSFLEGYDQELLFASHSIATRKHGDHEISMAVAMSNSNIAIAQAVETVITAESSSTISTQLIDMTALPTENNTVIAAIATGDTAQSSIADRFIASIRRRGKFDGFVLLLTDAAGLDKYKKVLTETTNRHSMQMFKEAIIHDKTIIAPVWEEDMNPVNGKNLPIQYNGHMKSKRLKTVFDKYVDAYVDKRLQEENRQHNDAEKMRFILYLDVDNVIANPLDALFQDYSTTVGKKFHAIENNIKTQFTNGSNSSHVQPFSFFSMWKETTKEEHGVATAFRWQGGQILQDRLFAKGCADAWRQQFDTHPKRRMDQGLFNNIVVKKVDEFRCIVLELPTGHKDMGGKATRSHYDKLNEDILSKPVDDLPTVIHITSRRTHQLDVTEQKAFLRKALGVDDGKDNQEALDWDKIISVVNGKGQEY